MDRPKPTVWTAKRQWLGNLLPLLFWLPLTGGGVALALTGQDLFGWPLALVAAGQALGWLATNYLSASFNRTMRDELAAKEARNLPDVPTKATFVGMSTPSFRSALDPHEDVGLLYRFDDRLSYFGERYRMDIPLPTITRIGKKSNIHSILGLGFWLLVEGVNHGKAYGVLIEPREHGSARRNRALAKSMLSELQQWQRRGKA